MIQTEKQNRVSRLYPAARAAVTGPARRLWGMWRRAGSEIKLVLVSFVLIAFLLSLAFVALHVKTYYAEERAMAVKLARVTSSYALLLSEPLRERDDKTARRLLATIVADSSFIGASVLDNIGNEVVAMGRIASDGDHHHRRWQRITYSDGGYVVTLGTLVVQGSEHHFRQAWFGRAYDHLTTLVLLSIGLCIAVNLAYRLVIGRPLRSIMKAVQLRDASAPPAPIALALHDDMGQLAAAIDTYRENEWNQSLLLKQTNRQLEDVVASRTRELRAAMDELVATNKEAERLAYSDFLTGLPNRRAFIQELDDTLEDFDGNQSQLCLFLLDLDNFKTVNDTYGHPVGDDLLKSVAGRIGACLEEGQTLARLGGDEFAIVVTADRQADCSQDAFTGRLIELLNRPHSAMGKIVHSGCSIGFARFPDDAATSSELMAYADIALHQAKKEGRNRCCAFNDEMRRHLHLHDRVEADLRRAIRRNELEVHYQPQFCLADGKLAGVEALMRWHHPELGSVSPELVLGVAQERNLVATVSRLLIGKIIRDMQGWLSAGFDPGRVSVNVHPSELANESHVQSLIDQVAKSGLGADRFRWEMTEDCLIGRDNAVVQRSLDRFVDAGFSLSLDDFGTGYASLRHLRELPIAEIKIDRGFISNVSSNTSDVAVVATVVHLASQLGLDVVAEGIETEQQMGVLGANPKIIGQGYLLGKPCPPGELMQAAWRGANLIETARNPGDEKMQQSA